MYNYENTNTVSVAVLIPIISLAPGINTQMIGVMVPPFNFPSF